MTTPKKPQDRQAPSEAEFVPAYYVVDGVKYTAINKLMFSHNELIEDATGKAIESLSSAQAYGLTIWLAVNAQTPSVTWDYFKSHVGIADVEVYNDKDVSGTEWREKHPKV